MAIKIIAEIAQAHDGSLGIAHSYIDMLSACGVDAVKFQTHIAEAESSEYESFRIKFSYEDCSRFDYWKRMEFTIEQWKGLKEHCEEVGVEFVSSPFSCSAVDLLETIGVKEYKIGSGEITNYLMLDRIAKTTKPIILSSGMSSYEELEECIAFLKPYGNALSLLQCTTAYPTLPEQWGLTEIPKLRERLKIPIGYSDHSSDITACIAAAVFGAEILEFHSVFDKSMFGPDSKASLNPTEISQLVKSVRKVEESLRFNYHRANDSPDKELKVLFGKTLSVNKDLPRGHALTIEDLESKKPGNMGVLAKDFRMVLGKKLNKKLKRWDFLKEEDLD